MKKNNNKICLWGTFNKRERWGLSFRGWLIGIFVTLFCFIFTLKNIYPFLSPTERLDSKILVVEGWMDDYSLKQALEEFRNYQYDHVYVTGGPPERGSYLVNFKTFAGLGASTLKKIGVPKKNIIPVHGPGSIKDRTYTSALALKKHFEENKINIKSFNLFSEGPHTKRSQLIFNLAFNNIVNIGVIAAKPYYYDSRSWWSSSAGFRSVFQEVTAYAYALFYKYTKLGNLTDPF
jgi:hypothetical protein